MMATTLVNSRRYCKGTKAKLIPFAKGHIFQQANIVAGISFITFKGNVINKDNGDIPLKRSVKNQIQKSIPPLTKYAPNV